MLSGGQEFVLIIIGMGMLSGAMTRKRFRHGMRHGPAGWRGHAGIVREADDSTVLVNSLKSENSRLADQVETMQDRLIVLEKIVTDRGYTLAAEIEALRDRKPAREAERND